MSRIIKFIILCSYFHCRWWLAEIHKKLSFEKKGWKVWFWSCPYVCWETNSVTGKSLSEALLFAEHGKNMLCTKIVLNVKNNFCTLHVLPSEHVENMSCTGIVFDIRNNFCTQHVLPMFCQNKSFWQRFTCIIAI